MVALTTYFLLLFVIVVLITEKQLLKSDNNIIKYNNLSLFIKYKLKTSLERKNEKQNIKWKNTSSASVEVNGYQNISCALFAEKISYKKVEFSTILNDQSSLILHLSLVNAAYVKFQNLYINFISYIWPFLTSKDLLQRPRMRVQLWVLFRRFMWRHHVRI